VDKTCEEVRIMKLANFLYMAAAVVVIQSVLSLGQPIYAEDVPVSPAVEPSDTAQYQMLVTTMGGLAGFSGARTLHLDARGIPLNTPEEAWHIIPEAMKMGDNLPLLRPQGYSAPRSDVDFSENPDYRNWKMKIYWGSTKTVPKDQPMVIATNDLGTAKGASLFSTLSSQIYKGPPKNGWGWGQWPNKQSASQVLPNSSLKGEHFIHGSYLPHIKFKIERHDFMEAIKARLGGDIKASIPVSWEKVSGSVGYFVYAMAASEAKREIVIWTSSSKPTTGIQGPEHSNQIRKLIDDGIALNAQSVYADIPAGIFDGYDNPIVMIHVWGEDYWASYPPKPDQAPKDWKPDWTVNALFYSNWTGMPGTDVPEMPEIPEIPNLGNFNIDITNIKTP
jgi:hypothetical protein